MTRTEFESGLLERLSDLRNFYRKYHPEGNYLSILITGKGLAANNEYWDKDKHMPVDVSDGHFPDGGHYVRINGKVNVD